MGYSEAHPLAVGRTRLGSLQLLVEERQRPPDGEVARVLVVVTVRVVAESVLGTLVHEDVGLAASLT